MSLRIDPAPALSTLTTMQVGGPPARFWRATTRDEIVEALTEAWAEHEHWFVLGGGSNVVAPGFADGDDSGISGRDGIGFDGAGFDGAVVHIASRGIDRIPARPGDAADVVGLRVQAGESWDVLVELAVAEGWSGIEAMSGIPGSVGAAPVQNIGAYGQELAMVLRRVEFFDEQTGEIAWRDAADLGLGYRTSMFKRGRRGAVLTVEIDLRATTDRTSAVRYPQLAVALGVELGARVPIRRIRAAVLELRSSKGMVLDAGDPASVSCGSFFVNPIVAESIARTLPADAPRWALDSDVPDLVVPLGEEPATPVYRSERMVKLSAAWLIERAGITRGFTLPGMRAGVSPKHTLAIVNLGGATAEDVVGLASYIQTRVASEFGIVLEPEPVILPARWS
jgi:UDP-N-acetylmuramate dehydrogenase